MKSSNLGISRWSFYGKEVEVIVIPVKRVPSVDDQSEWKKDFQSISQWDISEEGINIESWPMISSLLLPQNPMISVCNVISESFSENQRLETLYDSTTSSSGP